MGCKEKIDRLGITPTLSAAYTQGTERAYVDLGPVLRISSCAFQSFTPLGHEQDRVLTTGLRTAQVRAGVSPLRGRMAQAVDAALRLLLTCDLVCWVTWRPHPTQGVASS